MSELCEVCGNPAIVRIIDIEEIEPIKDGKGHNWMQWKPSAPAHLFCGKHKREPIETYRSETPDTVRSEIKLQRFMAEALGRAMYGLPPMQKANI